MAAMEVGMMKDEFKGLYCFKKEKLNIQHQIIQIKKKNPRCPVIVEKRKKKEKLNRMVTFMEKEVSVLQ